MNEISQMKTHLLLENLIESDDLENIFWPKKRKKVVPPQNHTRKLTYQSKGQRNKANLQCNNTFKSAHD